MTISDRIRQARQAKKLSQTDLARRADLNRKSLSRYELGSIPPADVLKAIAEALGVSADYLLGADDVPIRDRELLAKFEALQNADPDTREVVDRFLDLVIRDARARQAYA